MANYVNLFRNIQDEAFELFKMKNTDYGNSFEEFGSIGILVRMNDKIRRCITITDNNVSLVNLETLRDTLIDLHNYSALGILLMDKEKNNKSIKKKKRRSERIKNIKITKLN